MDEQETVPIYLEYGDIIKIHAPSNIELHQQSFFIKYIDSTSKVILINTSTLHPYILYYNEENLSKLRDESIEQIEIIWKSPLKGYILQNGLDLHKWIDIHFGGDFPVIFTGEITEIQDDQMEVTLYPSLEVIYIDFEYKGLPDDKSIEKIVLRQKPKYIEENKDLTPEEVNFDNNGIDEEYEDENKINEPNEPNEPNESIILIPENYEIETNIKDTLHNMYIDANDIVFDTEDIEIVNQVVELDSKNKIYNLDEQVTNLLDELLSTIPNNSRTKSVMDNIERIIVHFKRLRTEFSKMDNYGNIESPLIFGVKYKPLVKKIQSLSSNLRWIIPVVSINKTLYTEEVTENEPTLFEAGIGEENIDQINTPQVTNVIDNLKELADIQNSYFKNTNNDGAISKYSRLIKLTEKNLLPYSNNEKDSFNTNIIEQKKVESDIEAIIDNLQEFKTIVYKKSEINLQKYVIQKYNLGTSLNWIEGKKHAKKTQLTPNETISIKSVLMMPEEIVRFSKIDLPNTSILTRSIYSQNYPMTYKIFNSNFENHLERIHVNIELKGHNKKETNVPIEFNHEKREIETNIPFLSNFKDFTIDKMEEVKEKSNIEDSEESKSKKYERFLQNIVPTTYDLISLIQKYLPKSKLNGFSFLEMLSLLEPFAIYSSNITYNSYVRIRYFIKQAIINWKTQQSGYQKEYRLIREKKWEGGDNIQQPFFDLFKENKELQNQYYTNYKTAFEKFIRRGVGHSEVGSRGVNMIFYDELGDTIIPSQIMGLRTSEILNTILNIDCGKTVATSIRIILSSLTIPDKLIENVLNESEELTPDEIEKIKPSDCSRRFLTKKYKSLRDLQNDNHKEIYYDKDFDKTSYDLLTKDLKLKKEKMPAPNFLDYFAEILVQKSGVPRNISFEMANNIIRGKKLVMDGEYAVLETYPVISVKGKRLEEEGNINENEIIEKHDIVKTYYIRTKNVWKRDDTVDDTVFMDNNTLLCNLTETDRCVKRTKTDICQQTEEARREILAKTRASLFKEFDERIVESIEILKEKLEKQLKTNITFSKKIERMEKIQLFKENKYAFDLGEIDKNSNNIGTGQHSKWEVLLEKILSQPDFIKKQNDILTFTDKFTREPMIDNLNESPYWFYCCETNLKLLPIYIYELAKAYVVGGSDDYSLKLKEIVRKYGTLSEDGDSIVDGIGGSGRVIQKIDFVEEELFNDAGFKIQTKTVIEKDINDIVSNALSSSNNIINKTTTSIKTHRVFENETNETIYNILITICRNIGIYPDGIEDDVIRISSETVSMVVVNEKKYNEKMKKVEKPKPYIQYRNQNIILIVAFVTLVAIQSAVPPFYPENPVPGCILSFEGFPLEGGEDGNTDGVRYLACVLNISKSSIGVWSSIQSIKNPVQTFMDAMIKSISKHVVQREDVQTLFSKKREFLILNPNSEIGGEGRVPKAHTIQRWTTFLPPLIRYKIAVKLTGNPLSETFFQGFKKSLTKGDSIQWQEIGLVKTKIIEYTFAIIEYINNVVKKNSPLLNTISSVPFLQNACCNEPISSELNEKEPNQTVLGYFANKEKDIIKYIDIVTKLSTSIELNNALSLANIFVHAIETARKSTIIPLTGHSIENIYQSFIHYCKFDIETAPIPDYLKTFVSSKPPLDYSPNWSTLEKTKYLKENGKNYTISDLDRLLRLVNNRNSIESVDSSTASAIPVSVQIPNIDAIIEYINYLDDAQQVTGVIEDPLKKHLRAVLTKYRPNTMTQTDNEEIGSLKNYLIYSNGKMTESIYNFFNEYRGSIDLRRIEDAKVFIHEFAVWEDDTDEKMATMVRFTKNVIQNLSVIFPTMIRENKQIFKTVPNHWDLSLFHRGDVDKFIEIYYVPLLKFMGDNSINELLFQTSESLKVLIKFINYIPVINSLKKEGIDDNGNTKEYTFYSVFDKDTIYLLFKYFLNSVLYEYLQKSNDPDVVKTDSINIRNKKRDNNKKNGDSTEETKGADVEIFGMVGEVTENEFERLNEIQLKVGELENIKKKTVELLVSFLLIEKETKTAINKSYKTVNDRVIRTRLDEKKTITDYFKDMLDDERKLEYTLKKMKMGRWNLGMQKGVFEYDKGIYDKEHNDIVNLLSTEGSSTNVLNDYVIHPEEKQSSVAVLEMEEKQITDNEYNIEEWGIQHIEEDYMDGNYYGNDDSAEDRDFGEV